MSGGGDTKAEGRRPVRVLINALHSKAGGGVTYLDNIVPALAGDRRLDLHLLIHADQLGKFEHLGECARLHVVRFRESMLRTLVWEQVSLPGVARAVAADVVFSPANYGPLFVGRSVVLARNSLAVALKEARPGKILYWAAVAAMTLVSLMAARRAVAVSDYTVRNVTRGPFTGLRRKITVINHGVHPRFQPAEAPRGDTLLAVGDIYIQKNYHTLLEAFRCLAARHPELELAIAGRPLDGGYAAQLAESVDRLGLAGRVAFLGHVGPDALCRLYQTCRAFVFPSTVETFGNPLVEALACGTPTACSNRAAMPEIAGDAVEYFDPEDADGMAAAIERVLTDEARRLDLRARALRRAADFSWTRCARRLADVLVEAAGA